MTLIETWDLDSIFAGGSSGDALPQFLDQLSTSLSQAEAAAPLAPLTEQSRVAWLETIQTLYDLNMRLHQAGEFIECLQAQNVKDDRARQLAGHVDALGARLGTLWTNFAAACAAQKEKDWQALLTEIELKPLAYPLNEQRELARQKLDPIREGLINELATDGYHAWSRLYDLISGEKEVQFQNKATSLGQLQGKFVDDPNRTVRQKAFDLYEDAWTELAKPCALALNYQAGFRLTLYKHRAWGSVLQEPLQKNRLSRDTLEAMWSVIDAKSARLLDYFAAKAKLYGTESLSWYDMDSPVGEISQSFSYAEATDFVVDNVRSFNPDIADYCRLAIDGRWIEAEDRAGKQAGAFCTNMPLNEETRIFMTFNGSFNSLLTLAHELGHGYHSWVMRDLPYGARRYPMSLAETASTFNELIVKQAGLAAAGSDQDRLTILGTKLNDAVSFLMNIRARFDFEMEFFRKRVKGQLSVEELNTLMLTAQQNAYKNGLDRYHPLFWASKLHFYITGYPFYNFPYTFGYLFSNGLYAQAMADGPDFAKRYLALLRDTGSMSTEAVAQTHLGLDLTQPDFWEMAVDRVLADVDEFERLAASTVADYVGSASPPGTSARL